MTTQLRTALVTDSTGDIPEEEANALKITVVPAVLTVDGKSYRDGVDFSRSSLYERMAFMSNLPTTAAPSPASFQETYDRILSRGFDRILSVHISAKLSGILNVAAHAARQFGDRVHVFDSGQLSLGLGFQVLEAAAAALRGDPLDAVVEVARQARRRAHVIAAIDTLEFLRRSGRVGWIRASLGDLLQVKLVVDVADGVIRRLGQVRTRHKAVEMLLDHVRTWGPLSRAAVIHSAAPDRAEALAQRVAAACGIHPITVDVTTAIGAHVGPGSVGAVGLSSGP